jgi:alpha-mannosidase
MSPPTLFLVCNAHLDPVWLWEWEEGMGEALATFRAAARFCEEQEGFVFCHNEALLYEWVEEHEPALFARLRVLVAAGRWHVMGGWYLQPDCNLPSGESLVRQITVGKRYFRERFGVEPRVAVNLDPFGHTRGLVQILAKSGFQGYLFCRPDAKFLTLPADDFRWIGYDGSEITAHRAADHYNSERGRAAEKIRGWLERHPDHQPGLLLWGIGDHGGGPSREDLEGIARLQAGPEPGGRRIVHGRPEDYFDALAASGCELPEHAGDLNPWAVGCYTSMARLKRRHRRLEGMLYGIEKLLLQAGLEGRLPWPAAALAEAERDLLFGEFHDILPGSSIEAVERYALQRLDHGLEILERLRARAFFALVSGETPGEEGEYPLLLYNHHPWPVERIVELEFQPPEPNPDPSLFMQPELTGPDGQAVPFQLEQERCNIQTDQRKRLVFPVRLEPSTLYRWAVRLRPIPRGQARGTVLGRPLALEQAPEPGPDGGRVFRFASDTAEWTLDADTGLLRAFRVGGTEMLRPGALRPLLLADDADPWGMRVRAFREVVGAFEPLSPVEAARWAGVNVPILEPVRIIEAGPVRTVVEALLGHGRSRLRLRCAFPRRGNALDVEVRIHWAETDRMLKLALPIPWAEGSVRGEVAYGVESFDRPGEELVAQRWVGVVSGDGRQALTVLNDGSHGFDFADGELRLSLLRAPAHAGHPTAPDRPIVRSDRHTSRLDQGEHTFRFRIEAGPAAERLAAVGREALVFNEPCFALALNPPGTGVPAGSGVRLSGGNVLLSALKRAESGEGIVLRFFEPTGQGGSTRVSIPPLDLDFQVTLGPFELKTLVVDPVSRTWMETDLLERPLPAR